MPCVETSEIRESKKHTFFDKNFCFTIGAKALFDIYAHRPEEAVNKKGALGNFLFCLTQRNQEDVYDSVEQDDRLGPTRHN